MHVFSILYICKLFSFGPDAVLLVVGVDLLGPPGVDASVQFSEWLHPPKREEMTRTLINSTTS